MSDVRVRGTGGPTAGREIRLRTGDVATLGTPAVLRLRSLGEGVVLLEPLADGVVPDGVLLDGRPLVGRRPLDVARDTAARLVLPDGSEWSVDLGGPAADTPAGTALSFAAAPRAEAAPPLVLGPAPPPPPRPVRPEVRAAILAAREARRAVRRSRWRRMRRRARLPKAAAVSLGVHALLALLVMLALALSPTEPTPVAYRLRFRFDTPAADVPPEATLGTSPSDDTFGDARDEPVRSVATDLEGIGADLENEAGLALDEVDESPDAGVGGAPAGTLVAARVGGRERLLLEGGGDGATEGALTLALRWLARHQSADGSWSSDGFHRHCTGAPCTGPSEREYTEGATALALLPFLGAGHTHLAPPDGSDENPWRETVRDGLAALVRMQRENGSFALDGKRAYASAIGTLALVEAYGLTGSPALRPHAQRAVDYWVRRQSERGGWRYHPGDGGADSSVTGWVALALASARRARLDVPQDALLRCRGWFRDHTDDRGRVGYVSRGQGTASLLGVGYFCQVVLGADPQAAHLAPTVARLEAALPAWPDPAGGSRRRWGRADPLHWYYGGLAAFQRGGSTWKLWQERLRAVLLEHQERRGCAAGSWLPEGATTTAGGRVVTTALGALSLEVYYRYPRVTGGR